MRNLLPIGRFSQVTRLSVRMLRHYDELGLLKPALVDEDSGYRYYSLAQAGEAERIRLLRSLEMPLEEIRELLSLPDPKTVKASLERHKTRLEAQVAQYREVIGTLERLTQQETEPVYTVKVRQEVAQPVLCKRIRVSMATIGSEVDTALKDIYACLGILGVRPAGLPYTLYPDAEYGEEMSLEVGVPTEGPVNALPPLVSYTLPGGPVAYALHIGPYPEVGRAYRSLVAWMREHGHEAVGAPREIYLFGPTQTENSAEYRTEILWPIG